MSCLFAFSQAPTRFNYSNINSNEEVNNIINALNTNDVEVYTDTGVDIIISLAIEYDGTNKLSFISGEDLYIRKSVKAGSVIFNAEQNIYIDFTGVVLTTNNADSETGKLVLSANTDNLNNGAPQFSQSFDVNTNGGSVYLGGGNSDGTLYPNATDWEGIEFRGIEINTNGGAVYIRGESDNARGISFGGSTTINTSGGDIYIRGETEDNSAVYFNGPTSLDSGEGTIYIEGNNAVPNIGDARDYGIYTISGQTHTFISENTTVDAIKFVGDTNNAADGDDRAIQLEGHVKIYATGDNGGITLETNGDPSSNYGIVFGNGSTEILAVSGPIKLDVKQENYNADIWLDHNVYIGSKSGTLVPSSSSNVIVLANSFDFNGRNPSIATNGSFALKPVSTTNSFGQNVSTSWFDFNQNSHIISGLIYGKSGNTRNITHETNAIEVKGPIEFIGGVISIDTDLTSSADGDIFLKGISGGNEDVNNFSSSIIKSNGSGTLTYQANGRINHGGTISATGTATLNVVFWSDFDNDNDDGGVSHTGTISTNGGHVWMGGSNSDEGSYTWNGLTVGDGPSIGNYLRNYNALDLYGNVTTNGGDFMAWAGSGYSSGGYGITTDNDAMRLNLGTGDAILITDYILGSSSQSISLKTTGQLTLVPNGGSYSSDLAWVHNENISGLNLGSHFNYFYIEDSDQLSGLTIGKYTGTGLPNDSVLNLENTSNISIDDFMKINGPVSVYGYDIYVSSGYINTSSASNADILLKSIGHMVVETNVDLTTNGGDIIAWSNSSNVTTGVDNNEVDIRGNNTLATNGGDIILAGGSADENGQPAGYAYRGENNDIRSADLGQGVTLNSGGGNIVLRGQGLGVGVGFTGSGISINTSGGDFLVDGVSSINHGIWVPNNLSVNTNNGDLKIKGLANNSGQGIDFEGNGIKLLTGTGSVTIEGTSSSSYGVLVNDNFAINSDSNSDTAIHVKGISSSSFGIYFGTHALSKNVLIQSSTTEENKGAILLEGSTTTGEIGIGLEFWGNGSKIQILGAAGDITLLSKGHESRTFYTSTDLYIGKRANSTTVNGVTPLSSSYTGNINLLSEGGIYAGSGSTGLWTLESGSITEPGGDITIASDINNADGGFIYLSSGLNVSSFGGNITIGGGNQTGEGFAVGTTYSTDTGNGIRIDGNLSLNSAGNSSNTGGDISIRGKGYTATWGAYQLNGIFKNSGSTDINSGTGKIYIHGVAPTQQSNATSVGFYVSGGSNHYFSSANNTSEAIKIIGDSSGSNSSFSEGLILRDASGQFEFVATGTNGGISFDAKGGPNDGTVIQFLDPTYILANNGDISIKAQADNSVANIYSDEGGDLTLGYTDASNTNYDVTSSTSSISILSSGSIYKEGLITAKTNGGNFIMSTDTGSYDSGTLNLRGGLDIQTNGGDILLGGGDEQASGFAIGENSEAFSEGVRIDKVLNINSGGGDISIKGKTSTRSVGTANYGNSGVGFYYMQSDAIIDSGSGTIAITGINQNATSETTYSSGVLFALNNNNKTTITSSGTVSNAIQIIGQGTGTNGNVFGMEIEESSPLSILASGDGGGITLSTGQSSTASIKYDLVARSTLEVLGKDGPINLTSIEGGSENGTLYFSSLPYFGSKAGSSITESSSDILIQHDRFIWGANEPQIATTGHVTIKPFNDSFTNNNVETDWFGFNKNGQIMSGLTIGKPENTTDITLITDAITVAGPVSIYGGDVTLASTTSLLSTGTSSITIRADKFNIESASGDGITNTNGNVIIKLDEVGNSSNTHGNFSNRSISAKNIEVLGNNGYNFLIGRKLSDTFGLTLADLQNLNASERLTLGYVNTKGNIGLETNYSIQPSDLSGDLKLSGKVYINGSISLGDNLIVESSTGINSGYQITADGLQLLGAGNFDFSNTSNQINTLAAGTAADKLGNISFKNNKALTLGRVVETGIHSSGTIAIETYDANLVISENINTTSNDSNAIRIFADKNESIGAEGQGNIILSGTPSITVGTSGIGKLYSGKESSSTGLTSLVGGASYIRKGVDATTTTFEPTLTTGNIFALYRENNDVVAATISPISEKTYTGSSITVSPTVTLGGNTLTEGTDFTTSFSNNTNAGTASLTITGIGNFLGTKTVSFTIAPADIANIRFDAITEQLYKGSAITVSPTVTFNPSTSITDGLVLLLDAWSYTSGDTWEDKSSNGNDAILYNSPTNDGNSFTLNGSNQYFEVKEGFNDFSNGITVLAFVNFGNRLLWERIIDFWFGSTE